MLVIEIINTADHPERPAKGRYKYAVKIGSLNQLHAGEGKIITEGRIDEHYRMERWPSLVMQIAKQEEARMWIEAANGLKE